MEVLSLEGLRLIQTIEMGSFVLDVAFCEDTMYISLAEQEGKSIVEYQFSNDMWTEIDTDRWRITTSEESKAEIYWLETMRKKVGHADDD